MDNKIDIAKLLKGCPSGMELDCTMYENVYFDQIYDDDGCLYSIGCYTIVDGIRTSINFTKFGTFNTHMNSKCVIFPKGKDNWSIYTKNWYHYNNDYVLAWCKLSDIEPYKKNRNMKLILFVVCIILGACIIELVDCSIYNASIGNNKHKRKKNNN